MSLLGPSLEVKRSHALRESLLSSSILSLVVVSALAVFLREKLCRDSEEHRFLIMKAGLFALS